MTQTRAAFFQSLFLAPGAAIAAADRPVAEMLAKAEEFVPAPVYALHFDSYLSQVRYERIERIWTAAWQRKGFDPPSLLIFEGGSRIEAIPDRKSEPAWEVISELVSRGKISVNDARRLCGVSGLAPSQSAA
jgi:hypothetical protein